MDVHAIEVRSLLDDLPIRDRQQHQQRKAQALARRGDAIDHAALVFAVEDQVGGHLITLGDHPLDLEAEARKRRKGSVPISPERQGVRRSRSE